MNIHLGKPIDFWLFFGFVGQICFTMRFVVQWLATEKKKESVIPVSFWFYSIMGSAILLIYAIYRMDPVFILGQAFGFTVYIRNLHFIFKKKAHEKTYSE
jgi:lipid-A-disaccharide synthase-like uncharacterized protein